jgi:hypothetical protein
MTLIAHSLRIVSLIAILSTFGACAMGAQPEHMVPQLLDIPRHGGASPLRGAIAIAKVGGGEETNPAMVSKVGSKELEEALRLSLSRYGFLSAPNTEAPFRLEVFLIELKQPIGAFKTIVDSFVRYKLIESRDGKVVYDDIVTASFTAEVADVFYGPARLKFANERSIRANIAAFLERLNSLNVTESTSK